MHIQCSQKHTKSEARVCFSSAFIVECNIGNADDWNKIMILSSLMLFISVRKITYSLRISCNMKKLYQKYFLFFLFSIKINIKTFVTQSNGKVLCLHKYNSYHHLFIFIFIVNEKRVTLHIV